MIFFLGRRIARGLRQVSFISPSLDLRTSRCNVSRRQSNLSDHFSPMKTTPVFLAVLLGALLVPFQGKADHPLGDQLGTVNFEVSGSPEARDHVVRGVKLVHHMMYPEADR